MCVDTFGVCSSDNADGSLKNSDTLLLSSLLFTWGSSYFLFLVREKSLAPKKQAEQVLHEQGLPEELETNSAVEVRRLEDSAIAAFGALLYDEQQLQLQQTRFLPGWEWK